MPQPSSFPRRKSSEFLRKLSLYENERENILDADNLFLNIDRDTKPNTKKIESDVLCTVSSGKSEDLLFADKSTNGRAGIIQNLWNKGSSGDGDENLIV